jgi:hypothetical protein
VNFTPGPEDRNLDKDVAKCVGEATRGRQWTKGRNVAPTTDTRELPEDM